MKALDFNGNPTEDLNKAHIDFIKFLLLIPSGSVLGDRSYGFTYIDWNDDDSVRSGVNRALSTINSKATLVEITRYLNTVSLKLRMNDLTSSIEVSI
jgi:hypothetical protein